MDRTNAEHTCKKSVIIGVCKKRFHVISTWSLFSLIELMFVCYVNKKENTIMGHRTTLNVNVKINDFINYSKAGKAFSLLTLRKMIDSLSDEPIEDEPYTMFTSVMHVIGKDSINVIQNYEELYLVINTRLKNYNKEIETLADAIHEFFPYAEGTMLTIEDERYQPEIVFFTRDGLVENMNNVKFDTDNGVMPYVKADFDSELEADEEDVLDEFIKTFLEADSELLKRVQETVTNHVTTY